MKISYFFPCDGCYWLKQKEGKAVVNCATKIHPEDAAKKRTQWVMERWKAGVGSGAGHWFHKAQCSKNVVILLQTWAGWDGDRLATSPPVKQSIHHRNQDLFIWRPNSIISMSNSNSKKSKNPSKAFWWFYHPQYQRSYWQGKPSIKALMWYRGKWLNSSK